MAGYTTSNLDGETNPGSEDIFLVKFNASGERQWTRLAGTSGDDEARGIALAPSGDVLITGLTSGALDGNATAGITDAFLKRFDADGGKR